MSAGSENIEAAERYLAGVDCRAEDLGKTASVRRRAMWSSWAKRCWQCLGARAAAMRLRPANRPRLLSVAERLDLGPKKSLLVVSCGERRFLVASGVEGITAMLEIARPRRVGKRRRSAIVAPRRRRP
jgi:hypothetical protein